MEKIDILLWGVTGVTGRELIKYAASRYGSPSNPAEKLRFGIGGRSRSKVEERRNEVAKSFPEVAKWPVFIGDATNQKDMDEIVKHTRVVVSTVGPYALYGDCLVDSCVRLHVDYVDITGESSWVRSIIDRHHKKGASEGTFIIPSTGFDCVPADITAYIAEREIKKLGAEVDYVRGVVGKLGGSGIGGGTIASAINEFEKMSPSALSPFQLAPESPKRDRTVHDGDQLLPEYDKDFKAYTAPFPLSFGDTRVVYRSIFLRGQSYPYKEGLKVPGFIFAWIFSIILGIGVLFLRVWFLRALIMPFLNKPGEGPSEKALEGKIFTFHSIGVSKGPDVRRVRVDMISKYDAGYKGTTRMTLESAMVLALHKQELRKKWTGGVLTPSVLGDHYIERLEKNAEMEFRISLL